MAGLLAASVVSIGGLPAAHAVNLGTTTLSGLGTGYGAWWYNTSNGTQFKITGTTKDYQPGGNSIYWQAMTQKSSGICLVPTSEYVSGSCSQDFYDMTKVRGTDFNSPEWRSSTKYSPFSTTSKGHRANIHVCENRKLQTDPCSNWSISPSSYWFK